MHEIAQPTKWPACVSIRVRVTAQWAFDLSWWLLASNLCLSYFRPDKKLTYRLKIIEDSIDISNVWILKNSF